MRVDKFLKVSRLIKRRTLAKEICDQGRVQINGRTAKAGTTVAVGDEISIQFSNKVILVRVEALAEGVKKEEAKKLYTVLEENTVFQES